jgi:mannose-6-phosphate isomerase-like protein (cupin superfamily)
MKPKIVKSDSLDESLTSEGCLIAENYADDRFSIAHATVKPGVTTVKHHLKEVDEIYIITSGQGEVWVGNLEPAKVGRGDLILIPAETSQKITNVGRTDLKFYCVCTPRFTAECYCDEEQNSKKK